MERFQLSLFLPALAFALGLAAATLSLSSSSRRSLPVLLLDSRIVLCNSGSTCSGKVFRGEEQELVFPAAPPEGTFLLADAHLKSVQGNPSAGKARLSIRNGGKKCLEKGRIKKARLEVLYRRANDPDREFVIPPAHVVWKQTVSFPDQCAWHTLDFILPDVGPGKSYEETQLLIIKVSVLEIYGSGPVVLGGLILDG
ncbi:MAG: hypothetical protein HS115_06760 [Spirochaetales bacterium]|nr:hypothetical protein [Spirochaetales bacterium]